MCPCHVIIRRTNEENNTALQWTNFVTVGVLTGLGAALVALLADGRRNARRLFTTIALVMDDRIGSDTASDDVPRPRARSRARWWADAGDGWD